MSFLITVPQYVQHPVYTHDGVTHSLSVSETFRTPPTAATDAVKVRHRYYRRICIHHVYKHDIMQSAIRPLLVRDQDANILRGSALHNSNWCGIRVLNARTSGIRLEYVRCPTQTTRTIRGSQMPWDLYFFLSVRADWFQSPLCPENGPARQSDNYYPTHAANVTMSQCRLTALVDNQVTSSNFTGPSDKLELQGAVTRSPAGLQLIPTKCTQAKYTPFPYSSRT